MIKELYEEVQGSVDKCRNEYYLHLWELSDWNQEGMICLHELISREEELVEDIPRLRQYFKTKFRNRILDYIRKQESHKRRYNKEPYEEVGEISHRISEGGLWLDDYYLFHETLWRYRKEQSKEKQEELERVLRNEYFRGRQRVLRDLRIVFKEFDIRTH
ncbi:sigma-70 family RNA polymerase sigma factor [Streptococcus sp. SPS1]|uniref:sigma-70 family RNA polymerase sigma factor n=1 Tax=Streptococcus sp. SPS1 TaxID=3018247 RepID=UPI00263E91F1|nr:sigma-70 family RNA polymerase sigma factor [Streptococcus sp. SPS1]MDN5026098.1 sigma-70 family RNA polymerase sigma factor [Streptococcus sp. SPS1]